MPGRLTHFEIRAADAGRAQTFWGSLLGWEWNAVPGEVPYAMTETDGGPTGGLYESESEERGVVCYFDVEDLEAALGRVDELGGSVRDKGPVPGVGWYAHCVDTEGNLFGLFQSDESAPAPG